MCASRLPGAKVVATRPDIPLVSRAYFERASRREHSRLGHIWDLLDQVKDPEIPALSIWDLGVLAGVEQQDKCIVVSITPTYSGCPAMDVIREDVIQVLELAGFDDYRVKLVLSPAWSTDMMSPEGRRKLVEYGIAAPASGEACAGGLCQVNCPQCGSKNTQSISEFGSTACKALYQCQDCQEPFDYFKKI